MDNNKKEIVFFQCEKELKVAFYRLAQEKEISPGSLLRAFMRKAIKTAEEEKKIKDEEN